MKIQWNLRSAAASNAKTRLPVLAREFFRSGDKLAAAGAGPEQAHRFRIAAKQFRYTLELFRNCYDQELEQRLGMLKAVQQCLGDLNDLVTVQNLAEGEQMKAALEVRIRAKIQEFHDLWRRQFDRKIQASWVRYLSGRAGAGTKAPTVG